MSESERGDLSATVRRHCALRTVHAHYCAMRDAQCATYNIRALPHRPPSFTPYTPCNIGDGNVNVQYRV